MTDGCRKSRPFSQWRSGSEYRCASGDSKKGNSSRITSTAMNRPPQCTSRALSVRMESAFQRQEQPQQQVDQQSGAKVEQRQAEHHAPGPRGQVGMTSEAAAHPANETVGARAGELLQKRACGISR